MGTKAEIEAQIASSAGSKGTCGYCGRIFNADSLEKHRRVCQERPDKRKRKVFDSKKTRVVDEEQNALPTKAEESKKPQKKASKWKLQSAQFRNALKASGGVNVSSDKQLQVEIEESSASAQCPTCRRTFNEEAAKRHIPICANRAKTEAANNRNKVANQKRLAMKK
eukprot:TRINITY_DN2103_c0_g1_i3.p2 TRINITY_DN2103_c0_g1~~TRINITY_DN2103_c0_g1_i3.p2  ORF type:complete len:167 (+),score=39.40 TRINITY_DN2103_c0_g1_i3:107-607(+)